jgi:hypothetical protein
MHWTAHFKNSFAGKVYACFTILKNFKKTYTQLALYQLSTIW